MNKKIIFCKKMLVISFALMMVLNIFSLPSIASNGSYDYVIITTNAIVENSEELDFFIHMKEIKGHSVLVVTEDDFGGLTGQYPNDRADKIHKWLKDNYVDLDIEYVLLIGDPDPYDTKDDLDYVGDIPMKMCWPKYFDGGTGTPTDVYYGDLDSNWDLDGDGFYYELKDFASETSPHPSIGSDTFSVFWTGQVYCDFNVPYTFKVLNDDGVIVEIDGEYVIHNWDEHPLVLDEWTSPGNMAVGLHDINISFRENYGDGIIRMIWKSEVPSSDPCFVYEVIPHTNLYDANGYVGGLTGVYYDNNNFTEYKLTRVDPEIDFGWGTGDIGSGHPDIDKEVYVGRIPVYDADYGQLDLILRKIINYETDPSDISWRESILLPMERMDTVPGTTSTGLGEAIKNDIADPKGFYSFRIYEQDFNPPTPDLWPCEIEKVRDEWVNGYGMVTWHTHGGPDGAKNVMDVDNLGVLDDLKPAFTFQASCSNAHPETKNNLAYSLLKNGGIAMVAATRTSTYLSGEYTTFDPTKSYNHDMAYFYTKKIIENEMPAGIALNEVVKVHTELSPNSIRYNIYGDPECYLLSTDPNEFPVGDANGDYYGYEGIPVTFDASSSYDPEGDSLDYRWDFDNDGSYDTDWTSTPNAEFTWGDDYSGTVKVEVRDEIGKSAIDTTSVTIYNLDPTTTLDILNQPNPQFILPYQELTFEGSFIDLGWEDTHTAEWDYGDGTIESGDLTEENDEPLSTGVITGEHSYSNPGTYTVTLTVTDDEGDSNTEAMVVEVVTALESLHDLDDYLQNVSDDYYKYKAINRKKAFSNKFNAIYEILKDEDYQKLIDKLDLDIRIKCDGLIDGEPPDDWIIEYNVQYHICMKIDDITEYLSTFL